MPAPVTPRVLGEKRSDVQLVAVIGGVEFPLRPRECTSADVAVLRKATDGQTITSLLADAFTPDAASIDTIAGVVWLSRRQNGEPTLSYEWVADDITMAGLYDGLYELKLPDPEPKKRAGSKAPVEPEVELDPPV